MLPTDPPELSSVEFSRWCADTLHACVNLSRSPHPIDTEPLRVALQNLESVRYTNYTVLWTRSVGTFKWCATDLSWVVASALRMLIGFGNGRCADAFVSVERCRLAVTTKEMDTYSKWECGQAMLHLNYMVSHIVPTKGLLEYLNALETACGRVVLTNSKMDYEFVMWCNTFFYEIRSSLVTLTLNTVHTPSCETPAAFKRLWDTRIASHMQTAGARQGLRAFVYEDMMQPGDVAMFCKQTGEQPAVVDRERAVRQLKGVQLQPLLPLLQHAPMADIFPLLSPRQRVVCMLRGFEAFLYSSQRIANFFRHVVVLNPSPNTFYRTDAFLTIVGGAASVVCSGTLYTFDVGTEGVLGALCKYLNTCKGILLRRYPISEELLHALV